MALMNYIQLNDKGKFGDEEQKLADYFGVGNYTTFYKNILYRIGLVLQKTILLPALFL